MWIILGEGRPKVNAEDYLFIILTKEYNSEV
jgi:hypothetical protein